MEDPGAIKLELVMQGRELLSGGEVIDELIFNHPTVGDALKLSCNSNNNNIFYLDGT